MTELYISLLVDVFTQVILSVVVLYQFRERNQQKNGLRGLKNLLLTVGVICLLNKAIAIAQDLTRILAEPPIYYANWNIAWQNIIPKFSFLLVALIAFYIYQKQDYNVFTIKHWKGKLK